MNRNSNGMSIGMAVLCTLSLVSQKWNHTYLNI